MIFEHGVDFVEDFSPATPLHLNLGQILAMSIT